MQGEKEQRLPFGFKAFFADAITAHGDGKSKNTASATSVSSSSGNPVPTTSLHLTVTRPDNPLRSKSAAAFSALCWWNSNVCKCPCGAVSFKKVRNVSYCFIIGKINA